MIQWHLLKNLFKGTPVQWSLQWGLSVGGDGTQLWVQQGLVGIYIQGAG